jgi:16S rRNA (guanine966-N2)-methyltransferase
MKIIAGALKGRVIYNPPSRTSHPMSEKVRGALFNVLGEIDGLEFFDPFGGSGALSFEAISRGARAATVLEKSRQANISIDRTMKELGLETKVKHIKASAGSWSSQNDSVQFDVVLLAPPYSQLQEDLLRILVSRHAKIGGIIVLDWPGKLELPEFYGAKLIENKIYGDIQLAFYRKN